MYLESSLFPDIVPLVRISGTTLPNQPPVAANDTGSVDAGASVLLNVLANDTDPEALPLSVIDASAPQGTVSIEPDNRLRFDAPAGFDGDVVITYAIQDTAGATDTASVTVAVTDTASGTSLTADVDTDITAVVTASDGQLTIEVSEPPDYSGTYIVDTTDLATGPVNLVPPVLMHDGSPALSEVVSSRPGLWIYDDDTGVPVITYQWQTDTAGDGIFQAINGAVLNTYTPQAADVGDDLLLSEIATATSGTRQAFSVPETIGGVPSFAPDDLSGLVRWWDASANDLVLSGNDVTAWNGPPGAADYAMTPIEGNPPGAGSTNFPQSVPNAQNGRTMVDMPWGPFYSAMEFEAISALAGAADRSLFAVVRDVSHNGAVFSQGGPAQDNGSRFTVKNFNNRLRVEIEGTGNTTNLTLDPAGAHLVGVTASGGTFGGIVAYVDGDSAALSGTAALTTATAHGFVARNSAYADGGGSLRLGELLVFDGALSQSDRESIEGYLAHKWGIETQLPLTHPFRTVAP